MKRLSFIAALFGGAWVVKGQTSGLSRSYNGDIPDGCNVHNGVLDCPKPKVYRSGECPVCATMAPPYHRHMKESGVANCKVGSTDPHSELYNTIYCEPVMVYDDEGPTREIACQNCKVRFQQDAEKEA